MKLTYLGDKKPVTYYQEQINKIDQLSTVSVKITDFEGNETNYITMDKESIKELEGFLIGLNILMEA